MFDADIEAIILSSETGATGPWTMDELHITAGTGTIAAAALRMSHTDGRVVSEASVGDGPVEAAFKAIERVTGVCVPEIDYIVMFPTPRPFI